jgi:hypothetical protein
LCGAALTLSLIDLGFAPLAGAVVAPADAERPDTRYPLHARVCQSCWLVQTDPVLTPRELFPPELTYLSSVSETRLSGAKAFAEAMCGMLRLSPADHVVEIGSNDGYLLRWFRERGIPVFGVDPSARAGLDAAARGIPTLSEFFDATSGARLGARLGREGKAPRLVLALNVLTQVPDLVSFLAGVAHLLPLDGLFVAEVPHLQSVLSDGRFDLIRHEHFTCLSLLSLEQAAGRAGLRIVRAELCGPGDATLRIFAVPQDADRVEDATVAMLRSRERAAGLDRAETYSGFAQKAEAVRAGLIEFLTLAQEAGRRVAAYGAAAKGSALLNYCAIGPDLVVACADRNPAKQGMLLPGSRIPVVAPASLRDIRPDYLLLLPWNLAPEIMAQSDDLRSAGTQFVVAAPELSIIA